MNIKLLIWASVLLLLITAFYSALQITPLPLILGSRDMLISFGQRILIFFIFTVLFIQVLLDFFMKSWNKKLRILAYALVFFYLVLIMLSRYFAGYGLDPFYTFTQVCLLCSTRYELYLTLIRVSFWLLTLSIFTNLKWFKFKEMDYLVFLMVAIYELHYMVALGAGFIVVPFLTFAGAALLVVVYACIRKLPNLFAFIKLWLKS